MQVVNVLPTNILPMICVVHKRTFKVLLNFYEPSIYFHLMASMFYYHLRGIRGTFNLKGLIVSLLTKAPFAHG
jgi:hypothetical protein